jgi:DNA polymerase III epsilon subunit-like protein
MVDFHMEREIFVSVDVETSGPIPGEYSMLSIGACIIGNETVIFESFVRPTTDNYDLEALEAIGIVFEDVKKRGPSPHAVMSLFHNWVCDVSKGLKPIFVGFNSPFDWSFINYYFHKYIGENPFGFTALDIKSMYFGKTGSNWNDTRSSAISNRFGLLQEKSHNALKDAQYQAKLFQSILNL